MAERAGHPCEIHVYPVMEEHRPGSSSKEGAAPPWTAQPGPHSPSPAPRVTLVQAPLSRAAQAASPWRPEEPEQFRRKQTVTARGRGATCFWTFIKIAFANFYFGKNLGETVTHLKVLLLSW